MSETTLTAAEARLDAALAAIEALQTNLNRLGAVPPAADTALDDIDDLITIVRSKLLRAWAAIEDARGAREEYPDHGPTDPWETSGPRRAA
jgi:hypothetical protein